MQYETPQNINLHLDVEGCLYSLFCSLVKHAHTNQPTHTNTQKLSALYDSGVRTHTVLKYRHALVSTDGIHGYQLIT